MPLRSAFVGMRQTGRANRWYLPRQPRSRCGTADLARCTRHAWGVPVVRTRAGRVLCRLGKLVIRHPAGRYALYDYARSLAPLDRTEAELRLDHADHR